MVEYNGRDYFDRGWKTIQPFRKRVEMKTLIAAVLSTGLAAGLVVCLAGCSPAPAPSSAEKAQPKAPETATGSGAFYKCYIAARGWAADAQPYSVESAPTKSKDGKAGEWRSGFASAARGKTQAYTWKNGDVEHNVEDTYSPGNSSTQVFNVQFLKTDTDKVFAVAQQHGGDKLLEKTPDTPVIFLLEWNRQSNQLLWHVIYGADRETAALRVAVDASTGDFVRVEK